MMSRKLLLLVLTGLVLTSAVIALLCIDIWNRKIILDDLYSIEENERSANASVAIEEIEPIFFQRLWTLSTVIVLTIIGIAIWMRHKHVSTPVLVLFILLTVNTLPVSFRPAAESITRYHARVKMDIPTTPSIGNIYLIEGDITPKPAGVMNNWVAYYIGMVFPYDGQQYPEWFGGGYFTDTGVSCNGSTFYIEWSIDGIYHEKLLEGVTFGEQYHIHVGCLEDLCWCSIFTKQGDYIMGKDILGLPTSGERIIACASGESIWADNRMEATFSELKWNTYEDYPKEEFHEGLWDGTEFPCSIREDSPYSVTLIEPWYHFTLSGGHCRTLVISSHNGGTTNLSPDIYGYITGTEVSVKALPNTGYTFQKWLYDEIPRKVNPIELVMNTDHVLEAYFKKIQSVGSIGGGQACYMT